MEEINAANARIADMQRLLDTRKERENAANARIEELEGRVEEQHRQLLDAQEENECLETLLEARS